MKESEIKKLIKLVEESDISELEISRWGKKVRICKYPPPANPLPSTQEPKKDEQTIVLPPKQEQQEQEKKEPETVPEQLHEIKSPMVGTFYRAPSPDANPYVKEDDHITVGQVVCIIEAMKIMNEIESDVDGTIVRILVENEAPVEYGQTLFLVRPD